MTSERNDMAIGEVPEIVPEVNISTKLFLHANEGILTISTNPIMIKSGTQIILLQKIYAEIDEQKFESLGIVTDMRESDTQKITEMKADLYATQPHRFENNQT